MVMSIGRLSGSRVFPRLAPTVCALLLVLASASPRAANLLDLAYDKATNELVATIVYDGTNANHKFRLEWGPCQAIPGPVPHDVGADVIDEQGMDIATREYTVKARFGLGGFPCRPALVTLRMGPRINRTVLVP
jgi:hypothetical protein